MSKKITSSEALPQSIMQFHDCNIYLPTRTIYFGAANNEVDSDKVSCYTVSQLIKNLHILESKEIAPISLLLNTPGGSWEDGIAVYDLIRELKSKVNILGMGKVWSMGSIILQAGTKRTLLPNTTVMIHDGSDGYIGNAKAFEAWANDSKRVRHAMYHIYYERMKQKRPKITLQDIENMCSHDKIFSSKEAVNIGLADNIL